MVFLAPKVFLGICTMGAAQAWPISGNRHKVTR
jgi:hypothetical protein